MAESRGQHRFNQCRPAGPLSRAPTARGTRPQCAPGDPLNQCPLSRHPRVRNLGPRPANSAALAISALERMPDSSRTSCEARKVPRTDMFRYSITSSAVASSAGGIARPNASATLRLITNSYLVGACTGNSLGFAPLRMLSTYVAARLKVSIVFGP
jgi:hypothetical protein